MDSITVLICDDSIAVHESLTSYLNAANVHVVSVYDGESALRVLKERAIDLVILDIMLPKMFGTKVCEEIRKESDVPVLILSAKVEEYDRIIGLELGADDYVTKPFSPREVVTRVHTILKRVSRKTENEEEESASIIRKAELTVDMRAYVVKVNETVIEMTPKEIEVLHYLAINSGRVLNRTQILNAVWGFDYFGDTRAVDNQIKKIRQKLPETGVHFAIKAIYGVGYKLEVIA